VNVSPLISAIVVSYNTRDMTLECLRALKADLSAMPSEIWVVDNASSDGSAEAVEREFPDIHVLCSGRNAGFGAANNLAMAQARGELFLLVNSDAFLRAGCAAALVDCLERHPEAAAAGPRIIRPDGSLQISCFRFPSPARAVLENLFVASLLPEHPVLGDYRRWGHNSEREVDWVIGACMLVRRKAYEDTGGFDERFFMYAEETDWQKRMRAAGWTIWFTPAGEVVHVGGGSADPEARFNERMFVSLDAYTLKHHGWAGLLVLRSAMVAGCSLRAAGWLIASLFPARRHHAAGRVRRHLRLVVRQALHWRAPGRGALA
jgi:GT2 family glycosyltransferase